MNWYKMQKAKKFISYVERTLQALHYGRPDFDIQKASLEEMVQIIQETGTLPDGPTPERFATAVKLYDRLGGDAIWSIINDDDMV